MRLRMQGREVSDFGSRPLEQAMPSEAVCESLHLAYDRTRATNWRWAYVGEMAKSQHHGFHGPADRNAT